MFSSSAYHPFSIGVVAKDKVYESDIIEVYPIELMYMESGDVEEQATISDTAKLIDGRVITFDINRSVTVKADWKPIGRHNRRTSPDVRKGEMVILYQYANVDQYYWEEYGIFDTLRRKERVVYTYGNTDVVDEELNEDNTYWFEISTVDKIIRLHTSDNDGELTTYDLEIDTKNGKVSLIDGRENSIVLDSDKEELTTVVHNKINGETKEYNLSASSSINEETGERNLKTEGNHNQELGGDMNIDLKKLYIANDTAELMSTLVELLGYMIAEQHIGNMGNPTALHPASIANYTKIKAKLESFKK